MELNFSNVKYIHFQFFQNSSRKSLRTTTRRETRQRISVFECSKVYKGGTARNIYSAEEVHLFIDMPIFVLSVTLAFPYLPVFPIRRRGEEQGRNSPRRPHTAMTSSISRRERRGLFRFSRVSKGGRDQGQNLLKPSINSPSYLFLSVRAIKLFSRFDCGFRAPIADTPMLRKSFVSSTIKQIYVFRSILSKRYYSTDVCSR